MRIYNYEGVEFDWYYRISKPWSRVCKDCMRKFDSKDLETEKPWHGDCGVKGCSKQAHRFITFNKGGFEVKEEKPNPFVGGVEMKDKLQNVKKCSCGKVVDREIGCCWSCWNEGRHRQVTPVICPCGIDVTENQEGDVCRHKAGVIGYASKQVVKEGQIYKKMPVPELSAEETKRYSEQFYNLLEHQVAYEGTDAHWAEFMEQQEEARILSLIDEALESGSKFDFEKYTLELKQFKERATHG